jgi:IclR family transcriptional regulator, pca regulon regulatory protein
VNLRWRVRRNSIAQRGTESIEVTDQIMSRKTGMSPPKVKRTADRTSIASLAHGLSVLEAVARSEKEIPLRVVANRVHLTKTTTWRLAHTLVRLGYLRQNPETRCFTPSPRVLSLGYAYFDRLDLRQLAAPFLQELSARLNEMVNLAIIDGDELVFVDRIKTSQIISINLHIGSRLTLHNTALGRVLISEMPLVWLRQYMSRLADDPGAMKYIKGGGAKLLQMLDQVRERGYELSDNERVVGVRSVACPIRDQTRRIIAALNILVPSSRATMVELRRTLAPQALETSGKISEVLGFRETLDNR